MPTKTTSFSTDDVLTANDLNSLAGAWNEYTPTLAQGASTNIAKTVTYAKYLQFGKRVEGTVAMSPTGAGSAGSNVTVTLPVTASGYGLVVGAGLYSDTGTALYRVLVELASTTTMKLWCTDLTGSGALGVDPNMAVASGDALSVTFCYEAA